MEIAVNPISLTQGFARYLLLDAGSSCSHRLAKPHMTGIGVESWMPGHQEMKPVQFLRRLHKAQFAITFDN